MCNFFSVSNVSYLVKGRFLHQNIEVFFTRALKIKFTLCAFLDFAYFRNYLQAKETAWKRGDAIFSEPELIWNLLGEFWKSSLSQTKNYKNLMLQVDPLNSSCSVTVAVLFCSVLGYKYSERAILWRKRFFRKSLLQMQMSTIAVLKNLLHLMNSCNYCWEIAN